jgi:hypothetical protein
MLRSSQGVLRHSWLAVGIDTSMTALSACGVGYDAVMREMTDVAWSEVRWHPNTNYFARLADASCVDLVLDVMRKLWVIDVSRVFIAIEEPFPFGMLKRMDSGFVKQQCEVAGALKGAIAKWGFKNMDEINNSQWKAAIRKAGCKRIRAMPEGKWDIKEWAIKRYGLPDFPDLVRSKSGAKISRPETGYGANAKAIQPSDIYDAAACMEWMRQNIREV